TTLTTAILAVAVFQRDVFVLAAGKVAQLGSDRHRRAFLQFRHVCAWRIAHGDGDLVAARCARQMKLEDVALLGNVEQRAPDRNIAAFADIADILLRGRRVGFAFKSVKKVGGTSLRRGGSGNEYQSQRERGRECSAYCAVIPSTHGASCKKYMTLAICSTKRAHCEEVLS